MADGRETRRDSLYYAAATGAVLFTPSLLVGRDPLARGSASNLVDAEDAADRRAGVCGSALEGGTDAPQTFLD